MKKLLLAFLILLTSCDITKQAAKTKTDQDLTESILTKTKRIGDTVRFEVPKVVLKDTTIYTYNRVGTRLETRYNSDGQIDLINCMSSSIDELKEENRRILNTVKDKSSEKTEDFDSSIILYGFLGLGMLIVIIALLFVFVINKKIAPLLSLRPNKY